MRSQENILGRKMMGTCHTKVRGSRLLSRIRLPPDNGPAPYISHTSPRLPWQGYGCAVAAQNGTSPGNKTLQPHGSPYPQPFRAILQTNLQPKSHTMPLLLPITVCPWWPEQHKNYFCFLLLYPAGRHRTYQKRISVRDAVAVPPLSPNHNPPLDPVD